MVNIKKYNCVCMCLSVCLSVCLPVCTLSQKDAGSTFKQWLVINTSIVYWFTVGFYVSLMGELPAFCWLAKSHFSLCFWLFTSKFW